MMGRLFTIAEIKQDHASFIDYVDQFYDSADATQNDDAKALLKTYIEYAAKHPQNRDYNTFKKLFDLVKNKEGLETTLQYIHPIVISNLNDRAFINFIRPIVNEYPEFQAAHSNKTRLKGEVLLLTV